jgi:hypothetical protein
LSLAKEKNIFTEKLNFKGLGKFSKKLFFLMQEFYTFFKSAQNSASFDTLCAKFRRNFFSTHIRDGAVFSGRKSPNKIETVQY